MMPRLFVPRLPANAMILLVLRYAVRGHAVYADDMLAEYLSAQRRRCHSWRYAADMLLHMAIRHMPCECCH